MFENLNNTHFFLTWGRIGMRNDIVDDRSSVEEDHGPQVDRGHRSLIQSVHVSISEEHFQAMHRSPQWPSQTNRWGHTLR